MRHQVDPARLAAAQAHLQQRAALEESALPIMLDTMVRTAPVITGGADAGGVLRATLGSTAAFRPLSTRHCRGPKHGVK